MKARVLEVLWVMLAAVIVGAMLLLAGCFSMPACTWHPVRTQQEIADRCNDWHPNLRGCQIVRGTACEIWVRE